MIKNKKNFKGFITFIYIIILGQIILFTLYGPTESTISHIFIKYTEIYLGMHNNAHVYCLQMLVHIFLNSYDSQTTNGYKNNINVFNRINNTTLN